VFTCFFLPVFFTGKAGGHAVFTFFFTCFFLQVKREDTQPVFSFKLRGAYNMIANLPQAQV